ncbi:MAG TPA: DUF2127 domain-containing protein, partial [Casimicrobiaceae bacterium]|nr:DUF2127 domain-containing protein [Casimicrobiaceae bacterium]
RPRREPARNSVSYKAPTERPPNLRGWFGAQLRIVAVFEFAKGALVLVAGLGLLAFVHRDIEDVVEELLLHLHLNPASHIPGIFVALAERVASMDLWLLAIGAALYAALRIAEGYGLWCDREWAEWLGAASGLIYVPFELYALAKGVTPVKLATLGFNLLVVAVLVDALLRRRRRR